MVFICHGGNWLLTPPDTPLFPSLDDEDPQSFKQPLRGRAQCQPINASNTFFMNKKSQKNIRSSSSPCRLSASPNSNNNSNFGQSTSRPASSHLSATPSPPSRRPSTQNRPSTARSLTPTPKLRGTSPVRTSRGDSASPEILTWQSNILGIPSVTPPNLRTSLSDRPSSPMRGLSPTPRSGKGRHSMSPTGSRRSVSSSISNERNLISPRSKVSVVASCDDDIDSLKSIAVSSSSTPRTNGMVRNSRSMGLSKKATKSSPSFSVPKRSFESVIRHLDQRKAHQNMFRPLLSSVPATTFCAGKVSNTNHPIFSRNSSLTTSTSASSDQGNSILGECKKIHHSNSQEIFIFNASEEMPARNPQIDHGRFCSAMSRKVDVSEFDGTVINRSGNMVICTKCGKLFHDMTVDERIATCKDCTKIDGLFAITEPLFQPTDIYGPKGLSMVDGCDNTKLCSKCGKRFHLLWSDENFIVCQDCTQIDGLFSAAEPLSHPTVDENEVNQSELAIKMDTLISEVQPCTEPHEKRRDSSCEVLPSYHECLTKQDVGFTKPNNGINFVHTELDSNVRLKIESSESMGLSAILPHQLCNTMSPVTQSRAYTATNILRAESSYVRDDASEIKQSIERDSASTSSSKYLGSETDTHIHCQLRDKEFDIRSIRDYKDAKSQCSGSYSESTISTYESFTAPRNDSGDFSTNFIKNVRSDTDAKSQCSDSYSEFSNEALPAAGLDKTSGLTEMISTKIDGNDLCGDDRRAAEITLSRTYDSSDNLMDRACSCINESMVPRRENDITRNVEIPNSSSDSTSTKQSIPDDDTDCQTNNFYTSMNSYCVDLSEKTNDHYMQPEASCEPAHFPTNVEALHNHDSVSKILEDLADSSLLPSFSHSQTIHEESTVIVEGSHKQTSRSLTLAEATDTILFCSSIVHDIIYKAATIATEKEATAHLEASRPTFTIIGKPVYDHTLSRKTNRITTKTAKFSRKKAENQTRSLLKDSETNVIVEELTPLATDDKDIQKNATDSITPSKLESKCNCTIM